MNKPSGTSNIFVVKGTVDGEPVDITTVEVSLSENCADNVDVSVTGNKVTVSTPTEVRTLPAGSRLTVTVPETDDYLGATMEATVRVYISECNGTEQMKSKGATSLSVTGYTADGTTKPYTVTWSGACGHPAPDWWMVCGQCNAFVGVLCTNGQACYDAVMIDQVPDDCKNTASKTVPATGVNHRTVHRTMLDW